MATAKDDAGVQDQGSLDQPEQNTGPVNPVLDEHITDPEGTESALKAMDDQAPPEVDGSSASTLTQPGA